LEIIVDHRTALLSWLVLSGLLSVVSLTSTADAQDPNRSGRKFFSRGALGVGYVGLENDAKPAELKIDHIGAYWDLAAGVTVWKGLAVHGTYFGGFAWDPDVKQNGKTVKAHDSTSLTVLGVGPGATYHFYPVNLYLSYSIGAGWSVLRFHDNTLGSPAGWANIGFANEVMIGKEWWIGNGVGVGAAVQALYARVMDRTDASDINYNSFGGSLMFSATYH